MGEVVYWEPSPLPYDHVVCECGAYTFHVETEELTGNPVWKWLHCTGCGNAIAVSMTPVWDEGGL